MNIYTKKDVIMIILGIDPGIAIVGYGLIEYIGNRFRVFDYGSIQTEAGTPTNDRLKIVYDSMTQLIEKYKPDAMAIEELFFNTNSKTAIVVAEARGIILLSGVNAGIDIAEYTPLQVKQAVTGYGRADKNQVQQMTKAMLGLDKVPKPDDTADALAIAICHAHSAGSGIYNRLK